MARSSASKGHSSYLVLGIQFRISWIIHWWCSFLSVVCSENLNSHSHGGVSSEFRRMNPHTGRSLGLLPVASQLDFCGCNPKAGGRFLPFSLPCVKSELMRVKQNSQTVPLGTCDLGFFGLPHPEIFASSSSVWVHSLPLTEKEPDYVKRNARICDGLFFPLIQWQYSMIAYRITVTLLRRETSLRSFLMFCQSIPFNLPDSSQSSCKPF